MGDLLTEPLLSWTDAQEGHHHSSLPDLLAVLADQTPSHFVIGFDSLQAYQQHPWHAFLVQLAAMVLHRARTEAPGPADPDWWRDRLLELADGTASAWSLVVEDPTEPGFMQPPLPEGDLEALKNEAPSPDAIDILVAAKDHDVKHSRAVEATPEEWAYALITTQTFQGYSGRGNYGVARMNGGLGNRPGIATTSGTLPGERFREDVSAILSTRETIRERYEFADDGHALLWCLPWDGETPIQLRDCDPCVVEISRRIRLVMEGGHLHARYGASKTARIAGTNDLHGNVGDPWTPVDRASGKALTLSGEGFTYRKTAELLFGTYTRPPCSEWSEDVRYWVGSTLVRGQGKTEGFHTRIIPIARQVARLLQRDPDRQQVLGQRSKTMVEDARNMRLKILKPALLALTQTEREANDLDWDDAHPETELADFENQVDRAFFSHLWDHVEDKDDPARRGWQEKLRDFGREILEDAISRMRGHATFRYRAIAHAEGLFYGGCRKHFTALHAQEETT